MATPHVAGIAALFAQAHPGATATQLRDLLLAGARSLPLRSRDVGAGLVQAP
jgi:subtilisin family serine protease